MGVDFITNPLRGSIEALLQSWIETRSYGIIAGLVGMGGTGMEPPIRGGLFGIGGTGMEPPVLPPGDCVFVVLGEPAANWSQIFCASARLIGRGDTGPPDPPVPLGTQVTVQK
jgi:hypothetical protein